MSEEEQVTTRLARERDAILERQKAGRPPRTVKDFTVGIGALAIVLLIAAAAAGVVVVLAVAFFSSGAWKPILGVTIFLALASAVAVGVTRR